MNAYRLRVLCVCCRRCYSVGPHDSSLTVAAAGETASTSTTSPVTARSDLARKFGGFRSHRLAHRRSKSVEFPEDFRFQYPDFLPNPNFGWRHPLREKLERVDMLRRRENLEIPEFYAGSILSVTAADMYAAGRSNTFVGICLLRSEPGLRHTFILRNVIDGLGIEIRYDMYNPLIQQIEVVRLEKWLDTDLLYLRDALPEYSTIPFDIEAIPHPPNAPVPLNTQKVQLKPPPWHQRWEMKDEYIGIKRPLKPLLTEERYARLKHRLREPYRRMDLMESYRKSIPAEDQAVIYEDIEAANDAYRRKVESGEIGRRLRRLVPKRETAPSYKVDLTEDPAE